VSAPPVSEVRLDKWLQVARAFKTRSQATRACSLGRVRVNGERAKPHRSVRPGDRIEVEAGEVTRVLVVLVVKDRPVAKAEAASLFEDRSPPRPPRDPIERAASRLHARREPGAGRPTKRDRRRIERLRES
jgi:ribosome-associated heat shock protein Hsp15